MAVPSLDFSKYTHGSDEEKRELALQLVESLKTSGFVRLLNHGISDNISHGLLDQAKRFFNMPRQEKIKIGNEVGPHPQRGWSRVGVEHTSKLRAENLNGGIGDDLTDEKEHFDAGPLDDKQYPNRWPDQLTGFQPLIEEGYQACQNACLRIMFAIELGLGLAPNTLIDRCSPAASELRLLYYPSITRKTLNEGKKKRAWPHTDFGIITLLFQDSVGGLELEDRKAGTPRKFVPIVPGSPSEMILNTSDTFQRWTNDVVQAGLHQVTAPSTLDLDILPERYSSVFFFKAGREISVGPLPQFVNADRPAIYDEITALEYQKQKTHTLNETTHSQQVLIA